MNGDLIKTKRGVKRIKQREKRAHNERGWFGEHHFQRRIVAGTPESDTLIAVQSKSLAWQELPGMCWEKKRRRGVSAMQNFASGWNAPGCIVKG